MKNDNINYFIKNGYFKIKLQKNNNTLFLLSANSDYPSIEVKEEMECFVWGVVTYIIHESNS